MAKTNLTERGIAALKPADAGKRYELFDTQVPGLGLRINHKPKIKIRRSEDGPELAFPQGHYILYAPAKKGGAAVRHSLGPIVGLSLAGARDQALALKRDLAAGLVPKVEREKQKKAKVASAAETFGVAMEEYLRRVDRQRRGAATRSDIERDLLPFWKDRPLREITKADVRQRILEISTGKNRGKLEGKKTKKRGASPRQANVALSNLGTFFNWAAEAYDLPAIPTGGLKKLIPALKPRQRIFSDDELVAFWQAAGKAVPPMAQALKVLALTGGRYSEIVDAEWGEINERGDLLTIPPERFKSDAEHLVPLSRLAQQIIATVPRFKGCKFIFSRNGETPLSAWTKDRTRLASDMKAALEQMARDRGKDPKHVELKPFVLHDIRRSVRTRLSALQVPEEIAELVIGHGRKGLARVYNLHRAQTEMRDALEKWSGSLMALVGPLPEVPGKVVALGPRRTKRAGE